ncbi:hypothetical protein [Rhizobium sp. L1K21]|uniref:hypothetical protein n=1 Tax=Rhizobium sp. L1K21 TaxID=2954933 RepID=UPI002093D583|nr:hypothetical protein [Rhizobium sp. L1K21]MCO6186866.1 hypothetical protein [Rhizobium sp. L1K21]
MLIVDLALRISFGTSVRVLALKIRLGEVLAEIERLMLGFLILNFIAKPSIQVPASVLQNGSSKTRRVIS